MAESKDARPQLYLVPGLGADGRLFQGLEEQGLSFKTLEFIPPEKRESLPDYAARLAEGIDQSQPHIVGGVSLGGIISTEIARITRPEKLILISSVKNSKEFPFYFQMGRYVPVHRIFTGKFYKKYAPKERGKALSPEHRELLDAMRRDASPDFVKWAVDAVVRWKQPETPEIPMVHIHGTRDLMFPPRLLGDFEPVERGTHVMVLSHAEEVASRLRSHL